MALRTVKTVSFTAPSQIMAFEEGVTSTTDYEIVGNFIDVDGFAVPLTSANYSLKTTAGFTLSVGVNGTFFAVISEFGTPAVSNDVNIVALSLVKEYLNIGDTASDTFLTRWIGIVSDSMEKYTCSIIAPRNFTTLIQDGSGTDELILSVPPVISLINSATTDVQHKSSPSGTFRDVVTDVNDILIDPAQSDRIILYSHYFYHGIQNVQLNVRKGYSTIPQDFVQICIEKVAEIWDESRQTLSRARLGMQSVSNTGTGVNASTTFYQLSERHRKILDDYRYRGYSPYGSARAYNLGMMR